MIIFLDGQDISPHGKNSPTNFNPKQAGAALCQAQYKLELVNFLFGSVASLKFDCLVQTGRITGKIFKTSGAAAIANNQMSLEKCCKDKCCMYRC